MAARIVSILDVLIDGKWHALTEIQKETKLDKDQSHQIIEFLARYGFILIDRTRQLNIIHPPLCPLPSREGSYEGSA